ncbi:MAG: ABC transporter substrate-binding protein [Nitrospina sp.]|jgi:microcin C transport system substrate-binding protein|nr:ABC transporter substrate-binding protein [Nitrospina sp.]MBT3877333.1 ABC transporter substrate-binding protein [Nitrospina sp.]MBT4046796.1 ABC transporter substrate-binding protein [Nitrospina sp.]MBT4557482.1 ABC transporter substrate-binding protein [Nitrospina sp.]MBT5347377.1 ABC transporter substrate-binding protein [Nitrospina sp.]
MTKFFSFILLLLIIAQQAWGAPQHGLSLYGPEDLKYKSGQHYDHANPNAPKGGSLVLSDFGAFTKLNPASLKGVIAPGISQLVFQTAMDSSTDDKEAFSIYGHLVEKVELAEDRLSMTYTLYKQARFSDGHPLTADDFVFSFNLIKDPEYHPFFKEYFKDIKSIEKIDAHTVRYHFSIYNQELPLITGQMVIFPKHIYGAKKKSFGADFDDIAIASGPYTVEKYEYGKYITFKRDPNWWGNDIAINQGRYNFDRVTYKIYLDPVAQREAFKGEEFDMQLINSSRDWALDYKGDFVKKGYYIRGEFPHSRVAGMQGFAMNMRNEIFQSRKVRAAVAMAFDFEWSNKNLFYGQYTRNECYFDNNPEMKAQGLPQGEVKALLLDLRKKHKSHVPKTALTKPVGAPGQGQSAAKNNQVANALLDSAGWKIGADGIRTKGNQRLQFELLLAGPGFQRIAEPYKINLKKIGVHLDIKVVQIAEYEERLRNFKYDMIVASFMQSRSPGNEQRSLWGGEAAIMPGSRNYMGIKNPAIDELIDGIIKAKTRKDLIIHIHALDRILTHQFYMVPHWYISYDRAVYWNKFSRPKINPSQSSILNNLLQWWWWDDKKAQKLESAKSKGNTLQ